MHRQMFFTLIILMHMSSARPIEQNPVTTSAEVWSSLVVNIAPLLVLVGEKHVKAYFKTMSRRSHHLLFATAPIGLVTAVVTLIRLHGCPILKRIIGRQHETRAQLLGDVTSVSCGQVGLELRGMSLEQTIDSAQDYLAMFWVHGKKAGTAKDVVEYGNSSSTNLAKIFDCGPVHDSYQSDSGEGSTCSSLRHSSTLGRDGDGDEPICRSTSSTLSKSGFGDEPICLYSWCRLMSFRATGPGAMWLTRYYTAQTNKSLPCLKKKTEEKIEELGLNDQDCEGVGVVFARWSGVSLLLTASANHDDGRLEVSRYLIVLLCLVGNVGIIVLSWLASNNTRNTWLIAVGLFISSAGCWLTAWLVDHASKEHTVDLSFLSAFASGFSSQRLPEGYPLSICPQKVIMSRDATNRPLESFHMQHITFVVAAFMVVAYITLYLGLRSSTWWISLAMLANSTIAGVARSLFIPGALRLLPTSNERRPNPLFHDTNPSSQGDMTFPEPTDMPGKQLRQIQIPLQPDPLKEPVVIDNRYETVSWEYHAQDSSLAPPNPMYDTVRTCLQIVREMRSRKIAPLEWVTNQNEIPVIYSDVLTRRGIWRQPLEIIVPRGSCVANPESILPPLKSWYWRAHDSSAQKIAELSLDPRVADGFIDLEDKEEIIGAVITKSLRTLLERERKHEILWMMAKILYAVYADSKPNIFEEMVALYGGDSDSCLTKDNQKLLLESVIQAGLTCSYK